MCLGTASGAADDLYQEAGETIVMGSKIITNEIGVSGSKKSYAVEITHCDSLAPRAHDWLRRYFGVEIGTHTPTTTNRGSTYYTFTLPQKHLHDAIETLERWLTADETEKGIIEHYLRDVPS